MSCTEPDLSDIIEFCPESPAVVDRTTKNDSPPPVIIYVCSLCLRQYELIEDLRGHMIIYHKYRPIEGREEPQDVYAIAAANAAAPKKVDYAGEDGDECNENGNILCAGMRPVPFKDFRLLLRRRLQLTCTYNKSCAYKFENQNKLDLHIKCHKEQNDGTFCCMECGLTMPNWRRCSAHLWKIHKIDIDLLHCPICEYKSTVSVLVWRHMRVHKKWRTRVLRSMRSVMRRRQQQQQKPPEKKHKTKNELNNSTTMTAAKLNKTNLATTTTTTTKITTNKNKYYSEKICDICNRKFVNGKTLSKHVKTVHNKIKPFICNVCGKETARKASLIIHMRQHTGEKPLQCKSCKFSTRDPSVLHKHKQRHDNQGKMKCTICAYTCIQANAYKRHMRLNHPTEYSKMSCDLCNFSSINAEKLQAHKEDHRKGLITNCEDSMDASRAGSFKYPRKLNDKNNEISADCFMPLESIDSLPHEPALDTGGVTIPAPSEDTQFPTYLNN